MTLYRAVSEPEERAEYGTARFIEDAVLALRKAYWTEINAQPARSTVRLVVELRRLETDARG